MRAALAALGLLGCRVDQPVDTVDTAVAVCPPESWVTWDNFAEPVVTTWCLPCHSSALGVELRQGAPV
ncbi:MAG: hypothetical protein H0V89_07985, partial [Deltaproteobacteria bacterium]|nr:hypothetical protein [Deltaproteobacteria bacterium]